MPALGDVIARIIAEPCPVLCVDACAILDPIRAPARGEAMQVVAAQRVASAAGAARRQVWVVLSSVTNKEVTDHLIEEETKTRAWLRILSESLTEFNTACGAVSLPGVALPSPVIGALPMALTTLARSILAQGIEIDHDEVIHRSAYARVTQGRRPARHGRIKDAQMYEEYLELCSQLRSAKVAHPAVFITSNPKDFCHGEKRRLHPDLQQECGPVGLQFCMRWVDAVRLLGL